MCFALTKIMMSQKFCFCLLNTSLFLCLLHDIFRVDSWMTFKGKTPYGQQKAEKVKKAKKAKFSPIGFRPPKPKPEQRM